MQNPEELRLSLCTPMKNCKRGYIYFSQVIFYQFSDLLCCAFWKSLVFFILLASLSLLKVVGFVISYSFSFIAFYILFLLERLQS